MSAHAVARLPGTPAEIEALLPHAGAMSLLDRVLACDTVRIRCTSARHRGPGNPLAQPDGTLGAACLIELAAQAIALHAAIAAPRRAAGAPRERGEGPRPGLLVGLREVELASGRVDGLEGELCVDAERESADAGGALYAFRVCAAQVTLARGRATLVLAAPPADARPEAP